MSINYLTGDERPTADLMNELFGSFDAKLTTLLGGRNVFLAQDAALPTRLFGKAFFFTAGPAIYAPRVPGYIESHTTEQPVARPYNHAQFTSAAYTLEPEFLASATVVDGGLDYILNDVLTVVGGTLAPGGAAATVKVTLKQTPSGAVVAVELVTPGLYSVAPPRMNQVGGGHGHGALLDLTFAGRWDEQHKTVNIKRVSSGAYAGLPQDTNVGFFEHSLAAHHVLHQGRLDSGPVAYYLRETNAIAPEKKFKYAVAEIIIEGVTSVTIEAAWDKFACFRLHNLSAQLVTVNFLPANYSVTLGKFECTTVRRTTPATGYRRGFNYFFRFEPGDPRAYQFLPNNNSGTIGDDGRVANAMQANNLMNVAVLFAWVNYFTRETGTGVYAGFRADPAEQCDIYPFYKHLFGDPSQPTTLLGDLLHHRGEIILVRRSKTKVDGLTGFPWTTVEKFQFNGYATIMADFAAHGLSVSPNGTGNLQIENSDQENSDVYLVPTGTNLFKSGENVSAFVDLSGQNIFTIENAIFEDQSNPANGLSQGGPQLVQQPAVTLTTPTKTWYDYYDREENYPFAPRAHVVNGTPQVTLNWATASLVVSNIKVLDPGSGYAPDDQVQLEGGIGEAAIATVTLTAGGRVAAIKLSRPGNYVTPPNSPNFPVSIHPPERQGKGLILEVTTTAPLLNGIHKVTVADLLKLDWWGNPAYGDQNSQYVTLDNRKLTLTPAGLVLTFTETDSALPGDAVGQAASLPLWALGKRGLPQTRVIKFRGHGWGYPGDYTSAFLSPRVGRYQWLEPETTELNSDGSQAVVGNYSIRDYAGEVVARDGGDFKLPRDFSLLDDVRILRRMATGFYRLGTPNVSRFWKTTGGDILAWFVANERREKFNVISWKYTDATHTRIQLLTDQGPRLVPGNWEDDRFNTWFGLNLAIVPNNNFLVVPQPVVALVLLPEIFNALAQAVNALTTGVPLQWQCLRFAVGRFITTLDPSNVITVGRVGGNAFRASWPLPTFDSSGQITSQSGGGFEAYDGPKPLDQFGAFDQSSLYQQLCEQLGIKVQTQADFPGGMVPQPGSSAREESFGFFQSAYTVPAVVCDYGSDSELLSSRLLVAGKPTGRRCRGTYNRALFTLGNSVPMPGFPGGGIVPAYPDAKGGEFYVADDGSGGLAIATGEVWAFNSDDYYPVQGRVEAPLQARWPSTSGYGGTQGIASYPGAELYVSHGYGLYGGVNLNGFAGYRWVSIVDVQRVVESLGFNFLWVETCQPLELTYFEEPCEQNLIQAGPPPTGEPTLSFTNQGLPGFGLLVKFCVSSDRRKARWKIGAVPGVRTPQNIWVPEIVSVKARGGLSPYLHVINGNAWQFLPKPYIINQAQLGNLAAVNYSGTSGAAPNPHPINEGVLVDQKQVLGFNIYSSLPLAPIPVLLSGQSAWRRARDCWNTYASAYAATQFSGVDYLPWRFLDAPVTRTEYVKEYFGPPGQNGLTILTAGDDQRYWCCFSTAAYDLTAVTFADSNVFFSNSQIYF